MLNWKIDPESLGAHVPAGTELDRIGGHTYISLVGFHFRDAKILGLPVPMHQTFEEVNLRFYVRRISGADVRRGVTFIKETVPLPAVATTAKITYNEPYEYRPMSHTIETNSGTAPTKVEYSWKQNRGFGKIGATASGEGEYPDPGSHEEFITIRHWGYTKQRDGGTTEYRVEHPDWLFWRPVSVILEGDLTEMYGDKFAKVLMQEPDSAFLVDGSEISVTAPHRLTDSR